MTIRWFPLLLCALIMLPAKNLYAENASTIYVVCDNWKGYTNKDGTGAYWELIKAVYEPVGIQVNTRVMPWKRAAHSVKVKEADALVGDYYQKEKDGNEYLYPKWHISVEDPIVAVYRKDLISESGWADKGIGALEGKLVGFVAMVLRSRSFRPLTLMSMN